MTKRILLLWLAMTAVPPLSAANDSVEDRLEILNQVQAFPHLLDSLQLEEWAELFTEDAVFEARPPSGETLVINTREAILAVFHRRYREGFAKAQIQRRHGVSTIHVIEQTERSAHVETYLTISVVQNATALSMVVTGTYEFFLVKIPPDKWLISRLIARPDANRGEHTPAVEIPDSVRHLVKRHAAN